MNLYHDSFSANEWTMDEFLQSQVVDANYDADESPFHGPVELNRPSNVITIDGLAESSLNQRQPRPERLPLLQLVDWDQARTYDEDPPSCLHYSIEWKVTVNGKVVSKDTEQDLVLAPASYWQLFLQSSLQKVLRKKVARNRSVRCDDTNVVISVTERFERDLTKRFDDTEIDWVIVERQLLAWGDLFRAGKKLRVDLTFNYVEDGPQSASNSSSKGDKRGLVSTTRQMLAERDRQLDAEEDSLGQPSIWRDVYGLMRCPRPPCQSGPHCWRDPVGKKHYKLRTHHLKSLIRYVQQGFSLLTHDDVPEDIRQQLYAEEQHNRDRKQTDAAASPPSMPPIHITNVLPGPSQQTPLATSPSGTAICVQPVPMSTLDVPGLRDVAVMKYSDWQQAQVQNEDWKVEYRKACDVVVAEGLDLEQIHKDQDPGFLVKQGVKRGIARRFVGDIETWAKRYKEDCI